MYDNERDCGSSDESIKRLGDSMSNNDSND